MKPSSVSVEAARKITEFVCTSEDFSAASLEMFSAQTIESETQVSELRQVAEYFVQWVDDVWGSATLSGKTLEEYEKARAVLSKVEE